MANIDTEVVSDQRQLERIKRLRGRALALKTLIHQCASAGSPAWRMAQIEKEARRFIEILCNHLNIDDTSDPQQEESHV